MTAWKNGQFISSGKEMISIADRGFLLGDGLFETLLVRNGTPVFLEEHLTRLLTSASMLSIPVDPDQSYLRAVISELVERHTSGVDTFSARITLTRGKGQRGITLPPADKTEPALFVTVAPSMKSLLETVTCFVSTIRRNEGSPASRMKTTDYLDNILARQEAVQAGADEAIMLNNRSEMACATIANIFLIDGDMTLITPSIECGVLPGITRAKIFECASEMGLKVRTGNIPVEHLQTKSAFLTNSLMGLRQTKMLPGKSPAMDKAQTRLFLDLQGRYAQKVQENIESASHA